MIFKLVRFLKTFKELASSEIDPNRYRTRPDVSFNCGFNSSHFLAALLVGRIDCTLYKDGRQVSSSSLYPEMKPKYPGHGHCHLVPLETESAQYQGSADTHASQS